MKPTRRTFLSSIAALIPAWLLPKQAKAATDSQLWWPSIGIDAHQAKILAEAQKILDGLPSPDHQQYLTNRAMFRDSLCLVTSREHQQKLLDIGVFPEVVDKSVVNLYYLATCISCWTGKRKWGEPVTAEHIAEACGERWIPVTERLPATWTEEELAEKVDQEFVIVTDGRTTGIGSTLKQQGLCVFAGTEMPITHWRPLPAPPKGMA